MKTLYHGTSSVNLSSIKAVGLVPGHAKGGDAWAKDHHMFLARLAKLREPSVFLTSRAEAAQHFARYAAEEQGGDPILLKLFVPEAVFQTYVIDELYSQDDTDPVAWRAHSVDPSYVAEVLPVAAEDAREQLIEKLAELLSGVDRYERA